MTNNAHLSGRSLDELRRLFGPNFEQCDVEDILFVTAAHPELPSLEDLADVHRAHVLGSIALAEDADTVDAVDREPVRHWSGACPIRGAITPNHHGPAGTHDRLRRVRVAAARLLALQQLIEEGQVKLCAEPWDSVSPMFGVSVRLARDPGDLGLATSVVKIEPSEIQGLERLADSRRQAVLAAVEEGDLSERYEGAEFDRVINSQWSSVPDLPPGPGPERRALEREVLARLIAVQQLLEEGAVGLFLVEADDDEFDAVLRLIPCEVCSLVTVAGADPDAS